MSYGLRLFCLQETTQNSSNGARLSKPDALFLKKQTLEKLMQAFHSVQLKNATPSHRWHRVMIALWNDLLWIHCKKRIRFCIWNTPAATMQTQNKQREITDTNASRHLKRTLIIIPDNTWNVWSIYLRATCLHMWHAYACTVIRPLADATCSVVVIIIYKTFHLPAANKQSPSLYFCVTAKRVLKAILSNCRVIHAFSVTQEQAKPTPFTRNAAECVNHCPGLTVQRDPTLLALNIHFLSNTQQLRNQKEFILTWE